MLDLKFIRENTDLVKENIKKKFQDAKIPLVDKLLKKDEEYRKNLYEMEQLKSERNRISADINKAKKAGKDAKALLEKAKDIPKRLEGFEENVNKLKQEIFDLQTKIPNIMHKSVPIGKNDSENLDVKHFGEPKRFDFEVKNHAELAEELGVADFELSGETSGTGFYYIMGELALLNAALLNFARDLMVSKGYTYVETPLMLRGDIINNVTDLNDREQQIFKLEDEDLYLIGTSEHSLIGRYCGKAIPPELLPIKNTSYSMCFRKEIGSHGIDEKGLFRTHQFNKIEMVVICRPEESMKFYEEMKGLTIEIFTKLEIPIRELAICSGDLGELKHIQVDIEAWSPRKKEYFEVGSCSNLTEAQARKLGIRAGTGKERFVPHTLNNTAIATSRAMVAILENNQNKDGSVDIPDVLVPYMNGVTKIGPKKK